MSNSPQRDDTPGASNPRTIILRSPTCRLCSALLSWAANRVHARWLLEMGWTRDEMKELVPACEACVERVIRGRLELVNRERASERAGANHDHESRQLDGPPDGTL